MAKIIMFTLLGFSLLFVINCGSKTVPEDLTDEQLYEESVEKLSGKGGGFPWIFTGKDYDAIFS